MGTYLLVALAFGLGLLVGRWTSVTRTQTGQAFEPANFTAPLPAVLPRTTVGGDGPLQVWLVSSGQNKIRTIKAIRALTHLGLKDAKDLCESAPAMLCRVNTPEGADAVRRAFADVAPVEIR